MREGILKYSGDSEVDVDVRAIDDGTPGLRQKLT